MYEMFGRNLFLPDKIVESRFYDCKDEYLRDRRGFALHNEHVAIVFAEIPHTFVLETLLSNLKTELIANRVCFKTLSRSIYTSYMIRVVVKVYRFF